LNKTGVKRVEIVSGACWNVHRYVSLRRSSRIFL